MHYIKLPKREVEEFKKRFPKRKIEDYVSELIHAHCSEDSSDLLESNSESKQ